MALQPRQKSTVPNGKMRAKVGLRTDTRELQKSYLKKFKYEPRLYEILKPRLYE
jgi:hypothetical protein